MAASKRLTPFRTTHGFEVVMASNVPKEQMTFVWEDRWPRFGMTLVGGLEGTGKTMFLTDRIALLTNGKLPGCFYGEPITVLMVAYEDHWNSILVPRLEAAGADLDRVGLFKIPKGAPNASVLFPEHLDDLIEMSQHIEARVVVIDPFLTHLSLGAQADKNLQRTSMALGAIRDRTDEEGITVIGTIHPNKNSNPGVFLNSLWGSRGLTATARAVQAVVSDKEDTSLRLVLQPKNSGGRRSPELDTPAFRIHLYDGEILDKDGDPMTGVIAVKWEQSLAGINPDEYLSLDGDALSARRDAREMLWLHLLDVFEAEKSKDPAEHVGENPAVAVAHLQTTDKNQRLRTIERAYRDLVDAGHAVSNVARGFGSWKLTQLGAAEARSLRRQFGLEPPKPKRRLKRTPASIPPLGDGGLGGMGPIRQVRQGIEAECERSSVTYDPDDAAQYDAS
jgi:hypothetical protein